MNGLLARLGLRLAALAAAIVVSFAVGLCLAWFGVHVLLVTLATFALGAGIDVRLAQLVDRYGPPPRRQRRSAR